MKRLLALVTSLGFALLPAGSDASDKPNIIFILCDDLGYGDVKCLNPEGKIATPHMDRIAKEGVIFTDAHSGSSVCTPTRYGVMTGRYAWRSKLQSGVLGGLSPRLIEQGRVTVASMLKAQGYQTACIGKWHLGMDWVLHPGKDVSALTIESREQVFSADFTKPVANGPNSVGFDYYFGISASLDMVPYCFIENERVTALPIEDRGLVMFHGSPERLSRPGPAAPGFTGYEVLPTLTDKAVAYIGEKAADAREGAPFFIYLPFASPHTPILPNPQWQGKSGLNAYADFVMEQDAEIGRVLKALDDRGIADNTLVIVTSDNGCSPQARYEELLPKGHNPSANLRGHKADLYDGGHRVPFFVRWPQKVKGGQSSNQLVCLTDFMATAAEITGAKLPDNAAEDSFSFFPALLGESSQTSRKSIIHHSVNGSFAIREGDWKWLLCAGSGGWSDPRPGSSNEKGLPDSQLYHLASDLGERTNLQADKPEIVTHLREQLEQIVANGRSTPGEPQQNAVEVIMRKSKSVAGSKKAK